jgi:PAS domain S-box-containing protein
MKIEKKLKILHLEDLVTDAELVERELRKGSFKFELLLVKDKASFLRALKEFPADIILSDHSLPDIDSREALCQTKVHKLDIPFILITATISEEYAVEIMKEGAYDYILKDRFQRLPKAIENAIEKWTFEKERQRYLEETIASEARYRQIVETAHEGIWLLDKDFRTTFVNKRLSEILGYTQEEMIGRENTDFMDEEGKAVALKLRENRRNGIGESVDLGFITKDGKRLWASLSTAAIKDANGEFQGGLAMVTDITNRKLAEEKLARERTLLRTLIDNLPDYIFVKDDQSRHLINNKANVELMGYKTEEETQGKTIRELLPGDHSGSFMDDDQKIIRSGKPLINKEEYIITPKGEVHWLLTSKIPLLDEKGTVSGLIGISRDITELKAASAKLAATENRFRALVENITDGIVVNDANSKLIYQSPSVTRILGYSEDERRGHLLLDYVHPDFRNAYQNLYAELLQKPNEPIAFQYPFLHKSGSYVWLEGVVTNLLNDPSVKAFVANYRDITQRKKTEEELQQSEANLRAIFDNTNNGFLLLDHEHKLVDYNEAAVNLMRIESSSGKKLGQSVFNYIPENRHEIFSGYLTQARKEGAVDYDVEYQFGPVTKWIHASISAVRTRKNEFIGYCMTLNDYSEQKKAEMDIRANEERFRALVENTNDIIGIFSETGDVEYLSPSAERILGYPLGNLRSISENGRLHPEDNARFNEFTEQLTRNPGQLIETRLRMQHRYGHWLWLEGSAINLTNVSGINGIVTNFRDVTDRQLLEEDLKQKKYFLEKAQETAQVGYWIADPYIEKARLVWSKETCKIFGVEEHEFDGRVDTFLQFVHPEEREKVIAAAERALAGEAVYDIDHRIILRNGMIRWVHQHAEVVRDRNGKAINMIGIVQDITERKMIEEVLRQFNERYEILAKATNDAIWDWDIKIKMVTWNHGLETIFGYAETEVSYTLDWWSDRVHPEDYPHVQSSIEKTFAERQTNWNANYRFRTADGGYKFVYDRAYVLYDEMKAPVRMIGAMQDTSERMKAIEEIEKLSFVASKTDNSVMITDDRARIEWVNESFVKMTGYTLEEVKGRKPDFLRGPETDMAMVKWMDTRFKSGESVTGEIINYSKAGRKYWLKLSISPVFSDSGKLKNFISIQSDVTEQKEFENRITAIVRELASLIENANVPIFGIDRNGYINEWNKVSEELFGFSKSELLGRKWIDGLVSTENQQDAEQMIAHVLHGNPVGNIELPVLTKGKKRLNLLLSASPRRDTEKIIVGAILVAQDITELIEYRRNLEMIVQDRTRELNEALQKEKELVNMKSKFVSIASHEFRTPLSTISLASGFLKKFKKKLSPEEMDAKLVNIDKQVDHMTHLLDDVLMIGKAEAGKIPVRLVSVDIRDFFERLCKEVEQSTGRTHDIRVSFSLAVETILSDEKLLRNIVINGLTNAIKFSPGTSVVNVVLWTDIQKLTIHIKDHGIGIPAADKDQLFEPFYRASNVNAIQGTGLGLSIIRKAVELLHGYIDVKSEVGVGTELTITLPVVYE